MGETETIRIYLLGKFAVHIGDPPREVEVTSVRARWLLAYLALEGEQELSRSHLAGALWPEWPEARARRALNQTVWQIRRLLGPDILISRSESLALAPHVWVDVRAFQKGITSEDEEQLRAAVSLYQGDLLPQCYEDWALIARERLREQYLDGMHNLVRMLKNKGDYQSALHYAREVVRIEPLREAEHREIIQLYLILNQPVQALRQYHTLQALLMEELGIEPSPETRALYEAIQTNLTYTTERPAPLFVSSGQIPFVGRRQERALLLQAMEDALRGKGGIVLLEGAPGMGKSRLLEEVAEGARWRDMAVAYAQAVPPPETYAPLRQAVANVLNPPTVRALKNLLPTEVLNVAAHLWPVLGEPVASVRPRQLRSALVQVLLALTRCASLLLILDDVHNADPGLLHVLWELVPHLEGHPLLVILAYRPLEVRAQNDVWEGLLALDRDYAPLRVSLSSLSPDEQKAFVAAALGITISDPIVKRLAAVAGNVPLYTVEMLRYLYRQRILQRTPDGVWELTTETLPLPPTVPALVQQRVERFPPQTRQVLELLAVSGEHPPQALIEKLAQTHSPRVFHELVRHGFLIQEERYRFSHALVRDAIYEGLSPQKRRQLHTQIAQLLRTLDEVPWSQVAWHLQEAGQTAPAVHAHLQAARQAMRVMACEQVVLHTDNALALIQTPDPTLCDLLLLRGEALMILGRTAEARRTLAHAIHIARCIGNWGRLARACLMASHVAVRGSRYTQALRLLHRARTLYEKEKETGGLARTHLLESELLARMGRLEAGLHHIHLAIDLFEKGDNRAELARAYARLGLVLGRMGRDEADVAYEHAIEIARNLNDNYVLGAALNGMGLLALSRREFKRAANIFSEVLAIAERLGDTQNLSVTLLNLAATAANAGHWSEAVLRAEEALKASRHLRTPSQTHIFLVLAAVYSVWGQFALAEEQIEAARKLVRQTGSEILRAQLWEQYCTLARHRGNLAEAIEWGERTLEAMLRIGQGYKVQETALLLSHILLLAGQFDRAIEVARKGLEHATCKVFATFLRPILAAALTHTGQVDQAQGYIHHTWAQLERVTEDEYLPIVWAALAEAVRPYDEEAYRRALARAYTTLQLQCRHVPEPHQHAFLEVVYPHRLITLAWLELGPRPVERLRLALPSLNGRSPVNVIWTIDAGDEDAIIEAQYGPVALRRHRLKRLLREARAQGARATHRTLAEALGISVPTVRRDLATLNMEDDE